MSGSGQSDTCKLSASRVPRTISKRADMDETTSICIRMIRHIFDIRKAKDFDEHCSNSMLKRCDRKPIVGFRKQRQSVKAVSCSAIADAANNRHRSTQISWGDTETPSMLEALGPFLNQ